MTDRPRSPTIDSSTQPWRRARHRRETALSFETVRVEGGLLGAEFLATVANLQAPGQSEADYGIPKGLRLRDEIGRYWRIARALWEQDPDWPRSLLTEVLGFADLTPLSTPVEIDQRHFPLTHLAQDGQVPCVLLAESLDLDRSDPRFGDGGRRRSPHALVQEYLNADDRSLWGIVASRDRLRILRDNPSLTRPAYLEIDLEALFAGERYADFALLWLLAHASRFRSRDEGGSFLERWRETVRETGQRALQNLRAGVEQAIQVLGQGFLVHPENRALRHAIETGDLDAGAYYQELLRLIYRLLFLLVAEDRDLIHPPDTPLAVRQLYRDHYSAAQLRAKTLNRRWHDRHGDLWEGLQVTFRALAQGEPRLGLAALGGLFAAGQCPRLDRCALDNRTLLQAMRHLSYFQDDAGLVRVNFRDMDTEELGSVYESLLDLHPAFGADGGLRFELAIGGGARRRTGSYYTPDSLVQALLDSALEPLIDQAMKRDDPAAALLDLKIVDPACGSGHFLLGAARRLASRLAQIRAGARQPSLADYRHALREVAAHCLYGVDLNPLAIELCRTALWLETVEPGKPLGFLDARIRCGNALIGVLDLETLEAGIPDDAYKPLSSDDKGAANQLKKRNRAARAGGLPQDLFTGTVVPAVLPAASQSLEAMPEDDLAQIEAKRRAWEALRQQQDFRHRQLAADLYTAAFFAPKTAGTVTCVPDSQDVFNALRGEPVRPEAARLARELAEKHRFFHWPLEFPEVFARGGFDCVLGNPPWERIKLQEQEFFASRSSEIANAPNRAARERLIRALAEGEAADRALYHAFLQAKHEAEAASQFIRKGGRFPRTGVGDVNTYAVFAETALALLHPEGRAGILVPTGIATDDSTKAFFNHLMQSRRLVSLYDFENRGKLFPEVDSRQKFCLLTLGSGTEAADFLFFATRPEHLKDLRRHFQLSAADIALINPNTRTCPIFRSRRDAELTKKIYRRVPVLIREMP